MKIFQKITVLVLYFLIFSSFNLSFAEDIYYPYPIIFVHGINSDSSIWNTSKNELDKFFYNKENETYKYFHTSSYDYFPLCDYRLENNGDIPTIANGKLRSSIDKTLEKLPTDQRKVIVVCYSMGGLVLRSLLAQDAAGYYKSKIDKVIFLGTPNSGAPGASALWILKEVKDRILEPMVNDYSTFYSQTAGSLFRFSDNSSTLLASIPAEIYRELASKLNAINSDWSGKIGTRNQRVNASILPDPRGIALEQLRLSQNVYFNKTITARRGTKQQNIFIGASINGTQTFLGQASANLKLPDRFKVILFDNSGLGIPKAWIIDKLITMQGNFSFPTGESLDDVINNGDGIVSFGSQGNIGNVTKTVGAFHIEEPNQWQAILGALDDPPAIRSLCYIPKTYDKTASSLSIYILPKVKEYLLADIEISSMTLDGVDIRPSDFLGSESKYKPYIKFGKEFLKSCSDSNIKDKSGNVIPLSPGEFYVPATLADSNPHTLTLRVKNPAGKEAEASIIIQRPLIDSEYPKGKIEDRHPTIKARIFTTSTQLYEVIENGKVKLNSDGTPVVRQRKVPIDPNSITMTLDGSPITPTLSSIQSQDITITYTPSSDLGYGKHTVQVNASDLQGLPALEKTWTFTIPTKNPPIIDSEFPTGIVYTRTPNIGAHAYSPDGANIDLASIYMVLDGQSVYPAVSPASGGSSISITHYPQRYLDFGPHSVSLQVKDAFGLPAYKDWSFTVFNPNAFFEVNVPGSISRDTDFTMTVTAKDYKGDVIKDYTGPCDITISGDPAPTGELIIKRIDSTGWNEGVWTTTQQRYINGNESKYKLTITVTDRGSKYENMSGSADTIIDPLNLVLKWFGAWDINSSNGDWERYEGYQEEGEGILIDKFFTVGAGYQNYLKGGLAVSEYGGYSYHGGLAGNLYKIEIPPEAHIDFVYLQLRKPETQYDPHASTICKQIYYFLFGDSPSATPPDVGAEIRVDYSYNSPAGIITPFGECNLLNDFIGGSTFSEEGYKNWWGDSGGWKSITSSLSSGIVPLEPIPVPSGATAIWISIYPNNIKSMVSNVKHHADTILGDKAHNWLVEITVWYYIDEIYGYKR